MGGRRVRVGRSLKTLTDLGEFSRCEVDALLLGVHAFLLGVRAVAKRFELVRHLLNGPSEVS